MKHDNFLKAQEWLNSCDYPEIDSALEWLDAIALRLQLKIFLNSYKDEYHSVTPQEFFKLVKENDENNEHEEDVPLSKAFTSNRDDSSPIKELTLKDLSILSFCATTNSKTRSSFLDVFKFGMVFNQDHAIAAGEDMRFNDIEQLFSSDSVEGQCVDNWDNLSNISVNSITDNRLNIGLQHRAYLSIDLNCRKEELMNQFSKWLSTEKKAYGLIVKKNYQNMFSTWNSRKYLTLLDLESWANSKDVKLTTGQKIELLYPDLSLDDDNYRKTYKAGADALLSDSIISQLRSIANTNKEAI